MVHLSYCFEGSSDQITIKLPLYSKHQQTTTTIPTTSVTSKRTTNDFFTSSTIYHFHEKRHEATAAAPTDETLQENHHAHHPPALHSFATDSTINRLHADRHHGVIHATSPAEPPASKGRWPTFLRILHLVDHFTLSSRTSRRLGTLKMGYKTSTGSLHFLNIT